MKKENKFKKLSFLKEELLEITKFLTGNIDMAPIITALKNLDETKKFDVNYAELQNIEIALKAINQPTIGRKQLVEDFSNLIQLYADANVETKKKSEPKPPVKTQKQIDEEAEQAAKKLADEEAEKAAKKLADEEAEKQEGSSNKDENPQAFAIALENENENDDVKDEGANENEDANDAILTNQISSESEENQKEQTIVHVGEKIKLIKSKMKKLDADGLLTKHDLKVNDFIFMLNNKIVAYQKAADELVTILEEDKKED